MSTSTPSALRSDVIANKSKATRTKDFGAPHQSDGMIKRIAVQAGENQKLSQKSAVVFLQSMYGEGLWIRVESVEYIAFYIDDVRYEWHREAVPGDSEYIAKFYHSSVINADVTKSTRLKAITEEHTLIADPSNILVGDPLWIIGSVSARRLCGPCTVSKVGRKYFRVKTDGFNLDNVRFLVENLESQTKGLTLYKEEAGYRDQQELWMLKDKMRSTFASIGGKDLSLDQYRAINMIING